MDKRKIEILIAILVLLGVIVLLWFLLRGDQTPDEGPDTRPEPVETDDMFFEEPTSAADPVVLPHPIARTFVERFGSFSTESDYSNVDDVLGIVTPELRTSLLAIAEEARAEQGDAYYGVSTSVISITVVDETETSANVDITTQRQESFGSPGNTQARFQDIELDMIKNGDDWLVSGFQWQ